MAVSNFLKDVGKAAGTVGRAAGAVLPEVGKALVNEEAGYAPQIAEEQRKNQYKLEDQQIAQKSQILESQLATGQKYGTLTPDQQQQYVDQISSLYSHPRHAGTLMEKLRKAIHPNGAVAHAPRPALANPIPEGGTAKADEGMKESLEAQKLGDMLKIVDERAKSTAQYHKPTGKSPPVPGSQLPAEATGPDGQLIPMSMRGADKSFIEWNGAYYPAPKPKPTIRAVGGELLLIDPQTGGVMRKIAKAGAKVSTHQTPYLGDDGQMHLLTTYSVSTPQGETIEAEAPAPGGLEDEKPDAPKANAPKTPAKKVNPGSILPKTGAKPASSFGPVIPGSHAWANTKDPLYKAEIGSVKKANDDVIAATKLSSLADQVAQNPNDAINQKRLAVALERQASGRFTTQALNYVIKNGWGNTIEQWANNPTTGALPPETMRQLVDGAHQNLKASQDALKTAQGSLGGKSDTGKEINYKIVNGELVPDAN